MTLAVVTGGESGIGAACAVRLAEAGATARGFEPLLVPPPATDRAATDIAFAASAVLQDDGLIHLYYSLEDRMLSRAVVRAYD